MISSQLLTRILRLDEPGLRPYVALIILRSSSLTNGLNIRVFKVNREILLLDVGFRRPCDPAVFPLLCDLSTRHIFDVTDCRGLTNSFQTVIPLVQLR